MGLFTPEKTSKDYLKEIAKSQKDLAKFEKNRISAANNELNKEKELVRAQAEEERVQMRLQAEEVEKEYRRSLAAAIFAVEFDANSPTAIVQTLSELASQIDAWLKTASSKYDTLMEAAKSKFDTGLSMLSAVDSTNAMLPYFMKKKEEWEQLIERKKKINLITWAILIAMLVVSIIVMMATAEEYVGISVLFTLVMMCSIVVIVAKAIRDFNKGDNE